ncbi:MAG: hypothetical protein EBY52_03450 [Actinobacteria bacterium]|nr:hypothetical protein [Actinomycetota bacterium]
MIREHLSGKRIAITGSTGFLGTALVERLLRSVPDCELVLLVRPGRRGAEHRVKRDILKNDAFDRLRDAFTEDPVAAGGLAGETFDEMCDRRVFAVKGDVGQDGLGLDDAGLALFSTVDIAVHSAATVSFDSALDDAVQVNLLGPGRVSKSSPGCPRASSTSSPSTSWLRRSSPPPLAVRTSARNPASTSPTSSRSHRDRQTPSSTARWSTSCRPTSPKTRSTTKRTSPSRCPTGPSPAVAG